MKHQDIARAFFTSIDANTTDYTNLLADNHRFFNPMMPGPANKQEHLGLVKKMMTGLKGQHHLDLILSEGDHVVIKGRWSGTHAGDFNGIPATGKPVEFSWIDIMKIENGKITDEHLEMNPMAIIQQIT